MKSITAGLCLSLIGGVALAQTPPSPATPPAPASSPNPAVAQPAPASPPQASPAPGAPSGPQADGAAPAGPDGEIIETPEGFYLVRPGQRPTPLDIRPTAGDRGPGRMAQGDDGPDADAMPPRPHPRGGMPPRMQEGKGARFRIQTPSMTVGVKCPEEEPMKACVDAISGLLDKAMAPPHS